MSMDQRTVIIEGEYQGCSATVTGRGYSVAYEGGKRLPFKTLSLRVQTIAGSTDRTLPASQVQNGYALHAAFGKAGK